jgi:hypothetical protein
MKKKIPIHNLKMPLGQKVNCASSSYFTNSGSRKTRDNTKYISVITDISDGHSTRFECTGFKMPDRQ